MNSRTVYGPSWIDLSRVPARQARHTYALRSESAPDGWVSSGRPARRRKATVDPTTGLVEPVAGPEDDAAPVIVRPIIDYAAERKIVAPIRMGDLD